MIKWGRSCRRIIQYNLMVHPTNNCFQSRQIFSFWKKRDIDKEIDVEAEKFKEAEKLMEEVNKKLGIA